METAEFSILLVEDNPSDVDLTVEALRGGANPPRVSAIGNGREALRFLRREAEHAEAPRPKLVILDLNLPGMHGSDVLDAIKSDPELKSIPVLVFSSSSDDRDIRRAYDLHASCYVTKPDDFEGYVRALGALDRFWTQHVAYPRG